MVVKKKIFLLGCFFLVLFSAQLILANSTITNVHFEGNVTPYYDEGVFTINWTAAGNATANYTIYLWMNNVYVSAAQNTSVTNYTRSNITEANYTFTIQAANATNFKTNYTNISMYVDRTPPLVNWTGSGYNNVTYKKNTDKLTLNISVGDASSGVGSGNSYCVFDINETNETVVVLSGWCNTTQLNLTGLADGNHSINIWANDTVNNVGVNLSSYVVWVDTTAPPTPAFSCTPTSVYVAETITCSCSGTDASSGVASTSYTTNPLTAETGTLSTSCTITDNAGNSVSSSLSYIVGIRSGGSSSQSYNWVRTYVITEDQFNKGFTRELGVGNRVKLEVGGEIHYAGVVGLTSTKATINVSSISQQNIMSIGEEWRVEVTGDNYYDLLIKLDDIISGKADVTINSIYELIGGDLDQSGQGTTTDGDVSESQDKEKGSSNWWIWTILIVGLIIISWYLITNKRKKGKTI